MKMMESVVSTDDEDGMAYMIVHLQSFDETFPATMCFWIQSTRLMSLTLELLVSLVVHDKSNWTSFAGTFGYAAPKLACSVEVNEKCDVYSFGAMTVEVFTGRHPSDFILSVRSLSSSSASSLSSTIDQQTLLKDVIDQRLPSPLSEVANGVVFSTKLGFACLNPNPQSQPTMRQVSSDLTSRFPPLTKPFSTLQMEEMLFHRGFTTH